MYRIILCKIAGVLMALVVTFFKQANKISGFKNDFKTQ